MTTIATTHARSRRARGFTMIELMCVVAIIALCMFLVIPNLDSLTPKSRLEATARRIASTMDLAQAKSIGARSDTAIAYDFDQNTIWLVLPKQQPAEPPPPPDPNDPNAAQPPHDDLEHGVAPPADALNAAAPSSSSGATGTTGTTGTTGATGATTAGR